MTAETGCRSCHRDELPTRSWGLCPGCYDRHHREGTLDLWRDACRELWPLLDLSWREDALCAQTDPELFYPEKGGSTKEAKAVCAQCLVRAECLDYALATQQRFGVYGGLSERERRKLLGLPDEDSEEASAA